MGSSLVLSKWLSSWMMSVKKLEGCIEAHLDQQYQFVHKSVVLEFAFFAFVMAFLAALFCDSRR
jgi:hypothetical protein